MEGEKMWGGEYGWRLGDVEMMATCYTIITLTRQAALLRVYPGAIMMTEQEVVELAVIAAECCVTRSWQACFSHTS